MASFSDLFRPDYLKRWILPKSIPAGEATGLAGAHLIGPQFQAIHANVLAREAVLSGVIELSRTAGESCCPTGANDNQRGAWSGAAFRFGSNLQEAA